MLRFLTAGESHGKALVVILEGVPAGLEVTVEHIADELARRRLGYGRGPRMRFEADEITLLAGIRHGRTLGSPIAIEIANSEWERGKWNDEMSPHPGRTEQPLTAPRPGHADLAGMQKYDFDDARNVLERASARETAARVAAGAVAKRLLAALGVDIGSHVIQLGPVRADPSRRPAPGALRAVDASEVRCADPAAEAAIVAEIKAAAKAGDSLGGVVEVLAHGVPVGLGSHVHWDRKLDGLLAQALMSIQAVKGVEIGDGFDVAGRRGSEAHDAIVWDAEAGAYRRTSARAGGLEGGITTGEVLVAHVAMKPLATLNRPVLPTVDTATKEAKVSFKERTDVTAVPAMGVVAEAMTALVLANEALRKFGGDSMAELVRNADGYAAQVRAQASASSPAAAPDDGSAPINWDPDLAFADPDPLARREAGTDEAVASVVAEGDADAVTRRAGRHVVLVGMMGVGKSTVGRRVAAALDRAFSDSDEVIQARTGKTVREIFEHEGEPAFRRYETEVLSECLSSAEPLVVAAAGGVVLDPVNRAALKKAGTVVWLQATLNDLVERVAGSTHRPAIEEDPAGALARLAEGREGLYAEVADAVVDASLPIDEVVARVLDLVGQREADGAPPGPDVEATP